MHLSLDIHVEHPFNRTSQIDEGAAEYLIELGEELKQFNAAITDYYVDHDKAELTVDISPDITYCVIVLHGHWLKDYIKL